MKHLLIISLLLCITSTCIAQWADCGIPLTRQIYYQGVVVSPTAIVIASPSSDRSISVNVNVNLPNYNLETGTQVVVQVTKDGATYLNTPVGDLCSILLSANQVSCPLSPGEYSFSYLYELPPLPTGNYTVRIVTSETVSGKEIGCLSVEASVEGLGDDACTYASQLSADLVGTATFANNTIQIGPWGPGGVEVPNAWGTFKNVVATPDLVGYSINNLGNYVWGITGAINSTSGSTKGMVFQGMFVIGWLPDPTNINNAELVQQGSFAWTMLPTSGNPPYIFQSGTIDINPMYNYPVNFTYPLNLGNLDTYGVAPSSDGTYLIVTGIKSWCRCNCALGGGGDNLQVSGGSGSGISGYLAGTIAISVIGSVFLIFAIIFMIRMSRASSPPMIYDDTDLMDPQKPDYGTIAINEVFDNDARDYM
jgi:hypothetical protein